MNIYLIGCLATFILTLVCSYIDYECNGKIELRVKDIALMLLLIVSSYLGFLILLVFIIVYLLEEKGDHIVFKIKK